MRFWRAKRRRVPDIERIPTCPRQRNLIVPAAAPTSPPAGDLTPEPDDAASRRKGVLSRTPLPLAPVAVAKPAANVPSEPDWSRQPAVGRSEPRRVDRRA